MLTILFALAILYLMGKVIWFAVHAAWGIFRIVFIVLAGVLLLAGLAYAGLLVAAFFLAILGSLLMALSDLIL